MNYVEIERVARKLPPQDRIRLAESLLYSLRIEKIKSTTPKLDGKKLTAKKRSSLSSIQGILRVKGKEAPTDDRVKDMIADYLMEKYT